jgi:dTDP-4-amino-4,6-dideoxygalactose transaminase
MNYSAGDFPVTTAVASSIVSLPMYPQLTAAQQARVAAEVLEFTARSARPVEAAKGRAVLAEVIR